MQVSQNQEQLSVQTRSGQLCSKMLHSFLLKKELSSYLFSPRTWLQTDMRIALSLGERSGAFCCTAVLSVFKQTPASLHDTCMKWRDGLPVAAGHYNEIAAAHQVRHTNRETGAPSRLMPMPRARLKLATMELSAPSSTHLSSARRSAAPCRAKMRVNASCLAVKLADQASCDDSAVWAAQTYTQAQAQ